MSKLIKECTFVVPGMPKSKSNHSLVNADGKKILPKNSPYALYEKEIVNSILDQVGYVRFREKIISHLDIYFKHKERHPDLNNMTKSLCDGIEKSGIITNDRHIVSVYLSENYDYSNPRVEVSLYDYNEYKPTFVVKKRPKKEKEELIKELEKREAKINKKKESKKASTSKPTAKSKKISDSNTEIICSVCGNAKKKVNAKLIVGTNEYICLKCILTKC